jgi:hypothetical protein
MFRAEREVGALCARGFARHRCAAIFLGVLRRQRASRLERDFLRAKFFNKISGLLERHVMIVVAMHQQHGGVPVRDAMRF